MTKKKLKTSRDKLRDCVGKLILEREVKPIIYATFIVSFFCCDFQTLTTIARCHFSLLGEQEGSKPLTSRKTLLCFIEILFAARNFQDTVDKFS